MCDDEKTLLNPKYNQTIQERAIESIDARIKHITDGYSHFGDKHKEKVQKQIEVLEYLKSLVERDKI